MFRFHCMRKKPKIKDENQSNSENDFQSEIHSYKHLNVFTVDKHGKNLFFQCFKGNKKCSKDYSLTESHIDNNSEISVKASNCSLSSDEENSTHIYEVPFQNPRIIPQQESLAEKVFRLAKFGWYWGPLSCSEANAKLQDESDGSFLVRDSSCQQYVLTLSFKSHDRTYHSRIDHVGGMFSIQKGVDFNTVEDLIKHSMTHSLQANRGDPSDNNNFTIKLTQPISRFTQVRPLQYLCRFVIRQYVRADIIPTLPLPQSIVKYVEERQF